jgi:hypothetical protein
MVPPGKVALLKMDVNRVAQRAPLATVTFYLQRRLPPDDEIGRVQSCSLTCLSGDICGGGRRDKSCSPAKALIIIAPKRKTAPEVVVVVRYNPPLGAGMATGTGLEALTRWFAQPLASTMARIAKVRMARC